MGALATSKSPGHQHRGERRIVGLLRPLRHVSVAADRFPPGIGAGHLQHCGGHVVAAGQGWAPRHFPGNLKVDIRGRLQDKIMFGSDYPSLPYERIFHEWQELGYSDAVMDKVMHANAERVLGL